MHSWRAMALSVLLAACSGATEPADIEVELEREFRLLLGGTAVVEDAGLLIDFRAVENDSRCPPFAYCFWAGDAEVALRLRPIEGEAPDTDVTLHTNVAIGPASASYGVYLVSMIALEPSYRVAERTEYVVTLRVVQLAVRSPASGRNRALL